MESPKGLTVQLPRKGSAWLCVFLPCRQAACVSGFEARFKWKCLCYYLIIAASYPLLHSNLCGALQKALQSIALMWCSSMCLVMGKYRAGGSWGQLQPRVMLPSLCVMACVESSVACWMQEITDSSMAGKRTGPEKAACGALLEHTGTVCPEKQCSTLEILKTHLVFLFQGSCFSSRLDSMTSRGPFPPLYNSVFLWLNAVGVLQDGYCCCWLCNLPACHGIIQSFWSLHFLYPYLYFTEKQHMKCRLRWIKPNQFREHWLRCECLSSLRISPWAKESCQASEEG